MSIFAALSAVPRVFRHGIALAGALFLAACDDMALPGGGTGPNIDTSKPVPVALLIPRSDANAGVVAQSLENAARMAVKDLGEVRIDLRVYDTGGNAQRAAQVAQKAVDDGAKVILGPLFAEAANAAAVAVADDGVNVLSFSNNTSIAGGNLFVLGPTFENTANRLLSYARSNGKSSVLIVHPQTIEGEFAKAAIQSAAQRSGVRIAGVESFEFNQNAVVNAVPRIRDSARANGAQAVFMTSPTAGALPLLTQMLPEAGLRPETTQYIGLHRWDIPATNLANPGAQGGWFAMPNQAMSANFQNRYSAAYGAAPHRLAGLGFDGVAAIGALVKAGKSDALTRSALTQSAGFQGVDGAFRLRPNGSNERALAVATIQDRKVVILDPAPRSFGGAGF